MMGREFPILDFVSKRWWSTMPKTLSDFLQFPHATPFYTECVF